MTQTSNLKFRVEKGVFLLGLQRVQGVIDKRGASPIFSNVLLEGSGNRISMVATDLEIGIKGVYPADVQGEGGIAVSGKKLHEIVRELPDGDIGVEVEDGKQVTLRSGKSYFRIAGTGKEDFPSLPEVREEGMLLVGSDVCREMIGKTLFAVAEAEARHVLNGALLEIGPDGGKKARIKMVGTDGHRLAVCERSIAEGEGFLKGRTGVEQFIIPKKTLLELRRLLDVNEGIKIGIGEKQISFMGEDVFITSRLIEGNYPNYKQVIPQIKGQIAGINRSGLISAVRRISVMSREKTRAILIELLPGKAILRARDPEIGEAREEVDIRYEGEEITVGLNYQYLLDALDSSEDEEVLFEIQSNLSPVVIKQESDPDSLCIVMPMRVQEAE